MDDFLCEIDRSVKASRTVFEKLDKSTLRLISDGEWEQILQKVSLGYIVWVGWGSCQTNILLHFVFMFHVKSNSCVSDND